MDLLWSMMLQNYVLLRTQNNAMNRSFKIANWKIRISHSSATKMISKRTGRSATNKLVSTAFKDKLTMFRQVP